MIELANLPVFPCTLDKEPLVARGFKSARRGANTKGWPLVGFATGAVSGIDVLDVDPTGDDWYGEKLWALPKPALIKPNGACIFYSSTRLG